jgi:hypothetical protein
MAISRRASLADREPRSRPLPPSATVSSGLTFRRGESHDGEVGSCRPQRRIRRSARTIDEYEQDLRHSPHYPVMLPTTAALMPASVAADRAVRSVPPAGEKAAGQDDHRGTDVPVGRTYQHANREVLVEGDPLALRLRRSRARR